MARSLKPIDSIEQTRLRPFMGRDKQEEDQSNVSILLSAIHNEWNLREEEQQELWRFV